MPQVDPLVLGCGLPSHRFVKVQLALERLEVLDNAYLTIVDGPQKEMRDLGRLSGSDYAFSFGRETRFYLTVQVQALVNGVERQFQAVGNT